MTITLAAVYAPIAFQGGLTGSLFREFALTLAGAVTISGIVALTLSPMMSSRLLQPGHGQHGFSGMINRHFETFKQFYGRLLDGSFKARGAIYVAWVVLSVLAVVMFKMSAKELAPAEDQGVIFGIVNTPANSTIDQVTQSTRAINKAVTEIPETQFTFQLTNPQGGFWGDGLKPWNARKRNAFQILPDVQRRVSQIPGVQTFAIIPPALPGGGNFPVEVVVSSTAEPLEILGFANELQQRAAKSGMFAFPPLIDTKIDQPADRDRDRSRQGRAARPQLAAGGRGPGRGGRRRIRQPLQHRRPQLQGDPAARSLGAAEARAAAGHLRQRAQRTAGRAQHRRHPPRRRDPAQPEPLPAAQRGHVQRRRHPPARRGAASSWRTRRPRSCRKGYKLDYTGESRQLRTEGEQVPARLPLAIILIFLVLAAQFNSFRDPFIILAGSVPLALFGALIFTFLKMPNPNMPFWTNGWTTTLNIYSQVGLVTLVGLVAKNGILIVEFANKLQEQGKAKLEAVREAALPACARS